MITKDDVLKILDLETADYDTLKGLSELQRRVEKAHALLTEDKILAATARLSSENADDPVSVLSDIDALIDEKRDILKNAECDLKPTPWDEIQEIKREWLIPDWLPANTVTMFTGQGGAGKSWLTLQVACEIASHAAPGAWGKANYEIPKQTEYDDSTDNDPKHIVLATYEDEPAEIKRRLNVLCFSFDWIKSERKTIETHLHIIDMRGVGSVWGPGLEKHISVTGELLRSGEALRKVCEDKNARLLILDPLSGAFGGNENDRTAVYDFVSSFRGWGDAAKCAMLVIGHLPKTQGAGFSGSTAWEASARAMWLLGAKADEGNDSEDTTYYALQHTKSNYAVKQEDILLGKNANGPWVRCDSISKAREEYANYHTNNGRGVNTDGETEIADIRL